MITDQPMKLNLEELSSEVIRLLKANNLFGGRTIRYYTTFGLIDRPIMEGRNGKYNYRHVLQLLAIKTLQNASLPLSEIQTRLYGLSNPELEAVLSSFAASSKLNEGSRSQIAPKAVLWHEIVIEPGLKIAAAEGWLGDGEPETLEQRVREALVSLKQIARRANGG